MTGLVYQNTAALTAPGSTPGIAFVVAVRAPPVVGDVVGVSHGAQFPRIQDALDALQKGICPLVEHHGKLTMGVAALGLQKGLPVRCANGHGLFAQHVLATFQGGNGDLMVGKMGDGDDHSVTGIRCHQFLPVLKIGHTHGFNLGFLGFVSGTDGSEYTILGLGDRGHPRQGCAGEDGGIQPSLLSKSNDAKSNHSFALLFALFPIIAHTSAKCQRFLPVAGRCDRLLAGSAVCGIRKGADFRPVGRNTPISLWISEEVYKGIDHLASEWTPSQG